jgi:hypothetical protein
MTELKRRNVFRVGVAYAIVGWLLIEITATTFPILKLRLVGDPGDSLGADRIPPGNDPRLGIRDDT